jgi:hypothetical protein
MSPQEKRHGVMARIRTSDLTIERQTLYHLRYPANPNWSGLDPCIQAQY